MVSYLCTVDLCIAKRACKRATDRIVSLVHINFAFFFVQKFRFCGDLDCPDWILAEISILSKLVGHS